MSFPSGRVINLLFKFRGHVGGAAFALGLWLGRPVLVSCIRGVPLLLLGLFLRYWAAGHIGPGSRSEEIGGLSVVESGPYRLFRHPLYLGNLLLVLGMLAALRPPFWFTAVVLVGFAVEYGMFAVAEQRFLAGLPASRAGFSHKAALAEWPTWVAVMLAWALTFAKWLLGKNGELSR